VYKLIVSIYHQKPTSSAVSDYTTFYDMRKTQSTTNYTPIPRSLIYDLKGSGNCAVGGNYTSLVDNDLILFHASELDNWTMSYAVRTDSSGTPRPHFYSWEIMFRHEGVASNYYIQIQGERAWNVTGCKWVLQYITA
jgi:hypothetical protein